MSCSDQIIKVLLGILMRLDIDFFMYLHMHVSGLTQKQELGVKVALKNIYI